VSALHGDSYAATVDAMCRVPGCGKRAAAGEWREPFGKYRWGVHFTITVEDTAVTWPLRTEHADGLLEAALDTVGATLTQWGFDKRYPGPGSA
jgi:hypothetical protein